MPLTISLQGESGNTLRSWSDVSREIERILPAEGDKSFGCLRFVDLYGETIFNRAQCKELIGELDRLARRCDTAEARHALHTIELMASAAAASPHHYLRFSGD